ncbi:MAG: hypothetical protein V2G42_03680 [bacterium JZ-2024 1]
MISREQGGTDRKGRVQIIRSCGLIALSVTILLISGGTASFGDPPGSEECDLGFGEFRWQPDDPNPPGQSLTAYWNCPDPYKIALQNTLYLEGVYEAFIRMNGRNPTSWEELSAEPYMVVPLSSLRNAYENRPIRVIHEDPPCGTDSRITPGDIVVGHYPDRPELHIGVGVIQPSPPWNHPFKWCFGVYPAMNPEELVTDDYLILVGTFDPDNDDSWDNEDVSFDERVWMTTATPEEKTLAAIAHVVEGAVEFAPHLMKRYPIDWQDFKDNFYWASELRNPYTGQPIEEVSTRNPSPGNCTYNPEDLIFPYNDELTGTFALPPREQMIQDALYTTWPSQVRVFCYNRNLEPVSRWKYELEDTKLQNLFATMDYDHPDAVIWYLK